MNDEDLLKRINRLEFYQSLLLKMLEDSPHEFCKLMIKKSLHEEDVLYLYDVCEGMSKKMEEQKAEGFVYFHPLFEEFKHLLHPKLQAEEVISACLRQQIFSPLMSELKKYL